MPSFQKLDRNQARSVVDRVLSDQSSLQPLSKSFPLEGVFGMRIGPYECLYCLLQKSTSGGLQPLIINALGLGVEVERKGGLIQVTSKLVPPSLTANTIHALKALGPNDVEVFIHNIKPEHLNPKIKGKGWDNWGTIHPGSTLHEMLARRQSQTKEKTKNLLRELDKLKPGFTPKNILVLGCGDGYDVQGLLDFYGSRLKDAQVTAFDQSAEAIRKATSLCKNQSTGASLDFQTLDFSNIFSLSSKGKFDLVLGVGVFDRETQLFDDAVRFAAHLRMLIKDDGLLAACAYGYELLQKSNYEDIGYTVLQTAKPANLFTAEFPCLYIMQNTSRAIKSTEDLVAARSISFWS